MSRLAENAAHTRSGGATGEKAKESFAEREPFREPSHYESVLYLFGLRSFEWIASYLKRLPPHIRFVVLADPDESCAEAFLGGVPFFDILSGRTCVMIASDDTELLDEAVLAAFGKSGFLVGRRATTIRAANELPGSSAFAALAQAFERALSFHIENLGNSPEDSLLGLRQMALSSPWTLFGRKLPAFEGLFGKRPAVIVAAGPSLDRNLHRLKGMEDRLVIIAVDTVLEKLLKNGIAPHFVTALERGSVVYDYHFRSVLDRNPPELERIILVVQSVCVPRIAGRWPGPVIVVGKRDIVLDREVVGGLLGGGVIVSGSSVAHMGLGLACALGCPSAALIGQDLAFADDGRSHARQTHWEADSVDMQSSPGDRLRVPALNGGTVETTRIWRYFIDQFTRMTSEMPIVVSDCTEGGALIPGTTVRDLSAFLGDVGCDAFSESTASILERILDDPASLGSDLDAFDRRYDALQRSFHRAKALIGRGLGVLRLLEAPVLTDDRRSTLVRETRVIVNDLTASSPILTYIGQAQFASLIAENYRLTDLSDRPILMQWIVCHRSFLENQATAVSMIIGWLLYIDGIRQLSETLIGLLAADAPVRRLCEAFTHGGEETFRGAVMIDLLLSRVEPASDQFPETALLPVARHYMREKRFEEAARVLEHASKARKLETGDADLLIDRVTCLVSSDLCWNPEFGMTCRLLAEACRLDPKDARIDPLFVRLVRAWIDRCERTLRRLGNGGAERMRAQIVAKKRFLESVLALNGKQPDEAKKKLLAPHRGQEMMEGADREHAANVCDNTVW